MATRGNTSTRLPIRELFLRRNLPDLLCNSGVSPTVSVGKKTGKYYRLDGSNTRIEDDILTSRGGANEVSHDYTTGNFDIKSYGLKEWIDFDVYSDADPILQQEARPNTLLNVKDKLLLGKEKRLADLLFNASNFAGKTSALAGANRWDDPNSDPLSNFITASSAVLQNSGYMANSLVLGFEAMQGLQFNPAVLDLMGDNSVKAVTKAVLSKLLMSNGINIPENRIFVGTAQNNTAVEGQTDSHSFLWGKSALFAYIDQRPASLKNDTLVKTFQLKSMGDTFKFYKDADESKRGEWCHGAINYEHNIINNDCGYLFTTVVS